MPWVLIEEIHRQGGHAECVVIMEHLAGALPVEAYVKKRFRVVNRGGVELRRRFILALSELIADIHAKDIFHKDLKGTNLLVQEIGDQWRISVVDLDHVRFDKSLSYKERVVNLAQLNASVPNCIGRTDRWRFLRSYLKGHSREAIKALALDIIRFSGKFRWNHDA
jgi:tRNA A-37 threonylcarbamoyl transferase component Bud32